jgi:hypothetical protein
MAWLRSLACPRVGRVGRTGGSGGSFGCAVRRPRAHCARRPAARPKGQRQGTTLSAHAGALGVKIAEPPWRGLNDAGSEARGLRPERCARITGGTQPVPAPPSWCILASVASSPSCRNGSMNQGGQDDFASCARTGYGGPCGSGRPPQMGSERRTPWDDRCPRPGPQTTTSFSAPPIARSESRVPSSSGSGDGGSSGSAARCGGVSADGSPQALSDGVVFPR